MSAFPRSLLTGRKPPLGSALLSNHPLASLMCGAYLLNESGAEFVNSTGLWQGDAATSAILTNGAAGWNGGRPCDKGPGVRFDGTGYLTAGNPSQAYDTNTTGLQPGFSLAIKFRITTVPGGGVGIVSLGNIAAETQPAYLLQCNGGTNIRALVGDVAYQVVLTTPVASIWYTIVSTFSNLLTNNKAGTESHYLGTGGASQIYSGALTTSAGAGTMVGQSLWLASGFNGALAMDCEYLYIWDRCLTYREALDVIIDPYQMWDYSKPRSILKPAAAAGTAFNPYYYRHLAGGAV